MSATEPRTTHRRLFYFIVAICAISILQWFLLTPKIIPKDELPALSSNRTEKALVDFPSSVYNETVESDEAETSIEPPEDDPAERDPIHSSKIKADADDSAGGDPNHQDLHSSNVANLDLLDWEVASVVGIQESNATLEQGEATCRPPEPIHDTCCLGTFSQGGDVNARNRYLCAGQTLKDYRQVQQDAQQYLDASSRVSMPAPACDVCQIIQLAHHHNLTLSFFGDSMTNQILQGLICELQRRNYQVKVERLLGSGVRNDTNVHCKKCIKWRFYISVTSPLWKDSDPPVTIKFFFQYRYPFYYPQEELLVATSGDVLVINLGLHWSYQAQRMLASATHYKQAMQQFLAFLKEHGTHRLVAHRETSAQHFNAAGGDWGMPRRAMNDATSNVTTTKSTQACAPIQSLTDEYAGWRETIVTEVATQLGYNVLWADERLPPLSNKPSTASSSQELHILPYWNFSATHHKMHPSSECSHYCGSPFIYLTIWRGLRLAMDRVFQS